MKAGTVIKLEKAEEEALERLVKTGLFLSKDEAARAAIIKYASDTRILSPYIVAKDCRPQKEERFLPAS